VKRHEVPAQVVNADLGIHAPGRLECRAHPPRQDVALHAVFPSVRPDDYCHADFELDVYARQADAETAAKVAELDALVAKTQEAAAAAGSQPELALEPAAATVAPEAAEAAGEPKRARRARKGAA
jgi:hypothetical protein